MRVQRRCQIRALPRFPAVERDIALIVDADACGRAAGLHTRKRRPYFESAALFDVYTGDKLGEGKRALLHHVLRSKDRTLLDEEANAARDAVVEAAAAQFGAKLRD